MVRLSAALALLVSTAAQVYAAPRPFTYPDFDELLTENSGVPLGRRAISTSPVLKSNFPDPCVINTNNRWYAFATRTIGAGINIPVASSPGFYKWALVTNSTGSQLDAFPVVPSWVDMTTPNTWAPSVVQLDDGSFIMYYSATSIRDTSKHCVGAATSKNVLGPYVGQEKPLFCNIKIGGAIDASGYKDTTKGSNGASVTQRYIVYKVDGNSLGGNGDCGCNNCSTPLILQPVAANGYTFTGPSTTLLDNRGPIDDGVVEAPAFAKGPDGTYFLFFSSNCFLTDRYTVSYATANNIRGPYTRANQPLLRTGDYGFHAPGGADIWTDNKHMVFHVGPERSNRPMYTALITLNGTTVSM